MSIDDRPSVAQQQNILSLLGYDDQNGKIVAGLVDANLFEADYRLVAARCLDYWRQHSQAPKTHLPDLLADILEDPNSRHRASALRYLLVGMQDLAANLNTRYVLDELQSFSRQQKLTDAIIRCADLLGQDRRGNIAAVEELMYAVLRERQLQFDRGVRLDDDLDPFLDWLGGRHSEFTTGIDLFDSRGIVPYREALMLFIAGKGRGKSWWLINLGKQALLSRKKVLHVSLENDEQETRMRYYMALFAASQRNLKDSHEHEQQPLTPLFHYRRNRLTRVDYQPVAAEFHFTSPDIRAELETRLLSLRSRSSNLVIKRFPNRTLSVAALASYMDSLEQIDGFMPDLLLLDYAKLLKLNGAGRDDRRAAIGDNMEALRALAVERHIAVATADQLNRHGHGSNKARSTDIGEDWSQVHTADIVLAHSATDAEKKHGLARLTVEHARSERDKFTVLLAQSFDTGQFVLDSCLLPEASYFSDEGMMPRDDDSLASAAEPNRDSDALED